MNINQLPNEILVQVFSYELSLLAMFRLRLVCTHWNDLVELACKSQRSLVLLTEPIRDCELEHVRKMVRSGTPNFCYIFLRYNHESDSKMNMELSEEKAYFLVRMFPGIEHFILDCNSNFRCISFGSTAAFYGLQHLLETWAPSLETLSLNGSFFEQKSGFSLAYVLNQLTRLKRLSIKGCILLDDLNDLSSILPNLEMLTFDFVMGGKSLRQMIPHLTPGKCTELELYYPIQTESKAEWVTLNPGLMGQLTRLNLNFVENVRVLHRLCDLCPLLEVLRIECFYDDFEDEKEVRDAVDVTEYTISQLAKLKNLHSVRLCSFHLNLARMKEARNRFQLEVAPSVKQLEIYCPVNRTVPGKLFCSLFGDIFPNVEQFTLVTEFRVQNVKSFRKHMTSKFKHLKTSEIY